MVRVRGLVESKRPLAKSPQLSIFSALIGDFIRVFLWVRSLIGRDTLSARSVATVPALGASAACCESSLSSGGLVVRCRALGCGRRGVRTRGRG